MPEPSNISHTTQIRVRYADTDKMQIVYNGKYFEYFEVGRTELLRSLGLPYAELERTGVRLPVIEAHARYKSGATYDEVLEIECWLELPYAAKITLHYRVRRQGDSAVCAEGYTVHAFQDTTTLKPVRPPKAFTTIIDRALTAR